MMVNSALSRGLGDIAKVCLMTCGQSTCAELKKFEFCPIGHGGIAHLQDDKRFDVRHLHQCSQITFAFVIRYNMKF